LITGHKKEGTGGCHWNGSLWNIVWRLWSGSIWIGRGLTGWWSCEHDNDLSGTIKSWIAERLLATGGLSSFVIELYGIRTEGINTLGPHSDHIPWSS
jgi:hypothetical protein